jgi:RHS repeat-associated protein
VAYDADGNMTYLGEWYHTWDAENRLTSSQPAGFATNGAVRLEYVYNHKNLRVAKIKKQLSGRGADYPFNPLQPGTWDAIETRRYVWDGYNIAAEIVIDEVAPSTNVTYYTWGLDLSGTLQGAGGVGGLLAVTTADLAQPNSLTTYYPSYDANGNVTDYVDAAGNIRAHYEYSPFGEIVIQSGDLAHTFTHRFSTKPFDAETSLVMYQLRPYAPGLGRWMSRDPIGERGGRNLYGFVKNNSINKKDPWGLFDASEWPTECGKCKVSYVKSKLPGGGGQTDLGGMTLLEGLKIETCHLAQSKNDKNKFRISYSGSKCEATVRFDPDTDPDENIPGVGTSYRGHEWKHVQCMEKAFTWAKGKLATVEHWCCCDYQKALSVARAISGAAAYMRTTCSAGVDCSDYSKATAPNIRSQAESECAAYSSYVPVLEKKLADIEKLLEEGCK